MADETINQQTEDTTPSSDDYLLVWDNASGTTKKITIANLLGNNAASIGAAWTNWPVAFNAQLVLNNGVVNYSDYRTVGKGIEFRLKFTIGSTTAVGTGITISLPVAAHADYSTTDPIHAKVMFYDLNVTTHYEGAAFFASDTTMALKALHTDGTRGNLEVWGGGDPFTHAAGDIIYVSGIYEPA